MSKYRLTVGTHGRFEGAKGEGGHHIYRKGDEIELDAAQAAALAGRVEPLGGDSAVASPAARATAAAGKSKAEAKAEAEKPEGNGTDWEGTLGQNAPEIVALIPDLSADELRSLIAAEEAGKGRKGVLAAAEARLNEIAASEG